MESKFKSLLDRLYRVRPLTHAMFWIMMVLTLAYHGSLFGGAFKSNLINMLCILPVQMGAAYFLSYVQVPRWLVRRKYFIFGLSLMAALYVSAVLARLIINYIAEPILGIEGVDESLFEIMKDLIYLIVVYMPSVYLPALIFFLFKMTKERFEQQSKVAVLEKEKQTAELNFLKAQMNPHFLFNTLNNIFALAKNKSEDTPEMIMKLSEILGYTIYDCQASRVPLEKEWELIENYIDLESLRHQDRLLVSIEKEIENDKAEIAPLILISLVENAFKFALKSELDAPEVRIRLHELKNQLSFEVLNSKPHKTSSVGEKYQGIGVTNVKRQLQLQYEQKYQIAVEDTVDRYHVQLKIQL